MENSWAAEDPNISERLWVEWFSGKLSIGTWLEFYDSTITPHSPESSYDYVEIHAGKSCLHLTWEAECKGETWIRFSIFGTHDFNCLLLLWSKFL